MALVGASGLPVTSQKNSTEQNNSVSGDYILDGSDQDFMTTVIEASQQKPVLVDFWAPWCEPCKQYTPILEKAIKAEKGRVQLVKINIDENPMVAQQLQIQSLPTIVIFLNGRPVDAIPGVLPADTLKKLLGDLLKMSGLGSSAEEIQLALDSAEAALSTHDYQGAEEGFISVLNLDEGNATASAGVIRALIGKGEAEAAQEFYDALSDDLQTTPAVQDALQGLNLLGSGDEQEVNIAKSALEKNPESLELQLILAEAYLEANQKDCAIDTLLLMIKKDREWNDKAAQNKLLEIFTALGFQDPLAKSGRQRLSAIIFS